MEVESQKNGRLFGIVSQNYFFRSQSEIIGF